MLYDDWFMTASRSRHSQDTCVVNFATHPAVSKLLNQYKSRVTSCFLVPSVLESRLIDFQTDGEARKVPSTLGDFLLRQNTANTTWFSFYRRCMNRIRNSIFSKSITSHFKQPAVQWITILYHMIKYVSGALNHLCIMIYQSIRRWLGWIG